MVYQMQRQWKEALENYATAIEWSEKTGQHHELGSTYHQVGRVYQEQRKLDEASHAYVTALASYASHSPNSPDVHALLQSIMRLYAAIRKRHKKIPADLKQAVATMRKQAKPSSPAWANCTWR